MSNLFTRTAALDAKRKPENEPRAKSICNREKKAN